MDTDPARNLIAAQRPMTDTDPATVRGLATDLRGLPARMSTDAQDLMTDTSPATVRALATDLRGPLVAPFAFQTIRPVVSRKKRGFSAHFGPGGAVPPPRVSPFSKVKRSRAFPV